MAIGFLVVGMHTHFFGSSNATQGVIYLPLVENDTCTMVRMTLPWNDTCTLFLFNECEYTPHGQFIICLSRIDGKPQKASNFLHNM